ncbi:hypothetical protein ANCCAN_22511 [Ancylostoma caninum]|uniref:Uncharacterized protein n=1 Tax=Ancylostoma caninum TaxID=29170 RepID=A0A368FJI3_ANCCA|nr:hypothetical protein ANCCAN_22511 [Ancylostoma caninum]
MGTAAIKTVEMDQALAGLPVQYREIQFHESSLFLSYFPDGIRCCGSGVPEWRLRIGIPSRGRHAQGLEAATVSLQRKKECAMCSGM